MKDLPIPYATVKRLSLYLRQLERLAAENVPKTSSQALAQALGLTAAQVRKDLGHFGQFGRSGVGYRVQILIGQLRHILGTDRTWNVIVVGAGDLGRALLRYRGFKGRGFQIVAGFDIAPGKIGKSIGAIPVHHLDHMPEIVHKYAVKLAIVTVPAEAAQDAVDAVAAAGVAGVLNFAPATVKPPPGLSVWPVDLAASMEQLAFLVTAGAQTAGPR